MISAPLFIHKRKQANMINTRYQNLSGKSFKITSSEFYNGRTWIFLANEFNSDGRWLHGDEWSAIKRSGHYVRIEE